MIREGCGSIVIVWMVLPSNAIVYHMSASLFPYAGFAPNRAVQAPSSHAHYKSLQETLLNMHRAWRLSDKSRDMETLPAKISKRKVIRIQVGIAA